MCPSSDNELHPVTFESWDEYWAVRHDDQLWMPWFRWAMELGKVEAAEISILQPSQYPTARCGDVVVTIYPDAASTFDLEMEAHALIADRGLPIPRVVAAGTFPTGADGAVWQWLIESAAAGVPWNRLRTALDFPRAKTAATATGATLRRLHQVPHATGRMLNLDWQRFDQLVKDEAEQLGRNDDRLGMFPARLVPSLHELASETYAAINAADPPSLVHGDVHGDNVFLDPASGRLTALIDLNEMYVGEPWYDLADACFRLLRGAPGLVASFLHGYDLDLAHDTRTAERLLGWGLLHDFDGLTATVNERGIPTKISDRQQLAEHLTGLASAD